MSQDEFLSTGEVAKLCGVTSDAVLKWIKKGKIPASRTPGGHYRIPRKALEELPASGAHLENLGRSEGVARAELRCWEYFGDGRNPRESCRNCLVYLAKAQNCFRLAELGEEAGHGLHFCRNDCRTCSFYRACQGLATEVLIITADHPLSARLEAELDRSRISPRFAKSGYESSAIISTFRPAIVLMDSDLPEVRNGLLPELVNEDDRVPGVRTYVWCRKGHETEIGNLAIPSIPAPFSVGQLHDLVDSVARATSDAPRGVA